MARTVVSSDGDTFDSIAFTAYGSSDGNTEAVMAANPELATWGPVLPAGLTITLPDAAPPATTATVQLWD